VPSLSTTITSRSDYSIISGLSRLAGWQSYGQTPVSARGPCVCPYAAATGPCIQPEINRPPLFKK